MFTILVLCFFRWESFSANNFSQQIVRRLPGTKGYSSKFTVKTVKHPLKIMVWGCFSSQGQAALHFLEKEQMMNTAKYINILKAKLLTLMPIHNCSVFQQDSAPCHTALSVSHWFEQQLFRLLSRPAHSPNLNSIENLWMIIKKRLAKH